MYLLEGPWDEETASVIRCVYVFLVVEACVTKRLEILLLPRFGISCDRWVVFIEGVTILFERGRYPWFVILGRISKYEAGDFSSFQAGEAD